MHSTSCLKPFAALLVASVLVTGSGQAQLSRSREDPNALILSLLTTMPRAGGYSTSTDTTRRLQAAVQTKNGLSIVPELAKPSYCSGATYLVFLRALQALNPQGLPPALAASLSVAGQPDGVGVWGRWNANGPGTACLFRELKLGRNFTSFDAARPGDFMKIFWTPAVGRSEHGHSVIYLGRKMEGGIEVVRFWSSNQPFGFSQKTVPRSRIAAAIFSRLEYPENIAAALNIPARNAYLAGLISRESSLMEALSECGGNGLAGTYP